MPKFCGKCETGLVEETDEDTCILELQFNVLA